MESPPTQVLNFGGSLIVPNVQELAREPITRIPPRYVRPVQEGADGDLLSSVPVMDFQRLLNDGDPTVPELERLHVACKDWGFFQVINHGVDGSLLEEFRKEVKNFFKLDMEEKKRLWQKPDDFEGFGQLFVVSEEQKLDWSDMFYVTTLPRSMRREHLFKQLPHKLRETLEAYSVEVSDLAITIFQYMAKSLGMDNEEMKELFTDGLQSIRMNYYPPCPEPNLALGFSPHSDADVLTILFQLDSNPGLQIRKDGKWVLVEPVPNTFLVNVGDIMEILSNGIYKSVEHRVVLNSQSERLSVATFHSPNVASVVGPSPSQFGPTNPSLFKNVPVDKYFLDYFSRSLDGKSYLDSMKMNS